MTYDEFCKNVKILVKMVNGEGVTVNLHTVEKKNGVIRTGIVLRNESQEVVPTIYLEQYYEDYQKGRELLEISKEIVAISEDNKLEMDMKIQDIYSFQKIKDKICFRIMNYKENKKLLNGMPHIPYLDLAIYFVLQMAKGKDGVATMNVTNEMAEHWGIAETELYSIGKLNTERLFPVTVKSMESIFCEIAGVASSPGKLGNKGFFDEQELCDVGNGMVVITNEEAINGANTMLYDHILEEIAKREQADLYILPSSTHEIIVLAKNDDMNPEDLRDMVIEVNQTQVPKEDRLSDNVYLFGLKDKKLKSLFEEEYSNVQNIS